MQVPADSAYISSNVDTAQFKASADRHKSIYPTTSA